MLYGLPGVRYRGKTLLEQLLFRITLLDRLSPAVLSVSASLLFALRTSFTVEDRAGMERRDAA